MKTMEKSYTLNKAAFLILNGAELVGFVGKSHYDARVIVRTTPEQLEKLKNPLVNYQKYMQKRHLIKKKMWEKCRYVRVL